MEKIHIVGFEPTKHYARELESRPFDRSGMCTKSPKRDKFPTPGLEPGSAG